VPAPRSPSTACLASWGWSEPIAVVGTVAAAVGGGAAVDAVPWRLQSGKATVASGLGSSPGPPNFDAADADIADNVDVVGVVDVTAVADAVGGAAAVVGFVGVGVVDAVGFVADGDVGDVGDADAVGVAGGEEGSWGSKVKLLLGH